MGIRQRNRHPANRLGQRRRGRDSVRPGEGEPQRGGPDNRPSGAEAPAREVPPGPIPPQQS
jgi:hypothetical protein